MRLEILDLSFNSLSGVIPKKLGKLTSLRALVLNDNKFNGNLPEMLRQPFNLGSLDVKNNMLEGVVTESHFAKLTNLRWFPASSNHLTLNVISPNWSLPSTLGVFQIGSWNLSGLGSEAPSWLQNRQSIFILDLSNTGISFKVPSWFWRIPILDVCHNNLHGKIPHLYEHAESVYASSNMIYGSLPRLGSSVSELDLSNNSFSGGMSHFLCELSFDHSRVSLLYLGGNQLSGEIPDCWMKWRSVQYLDLGNNNMSGSIPHSIGHLEYLKSLNLYNNRFSGQIPVSLQNCTELKKIDLSSNVFDGSIPAWVGTSLIDLRILILRSNRFSGIIPSEICRLNLLQILDLSGNVFSGIIPRCVYNFTAMTTKRSLVDGSGDREFLYNIFEGAFFDSTSVATKGGNLHYDTMLALVTNIDLSRNNLLGDKPKELTALDELRSLNLSGNQFRGVIPENIGDMKQLECLDLSVNSLSGHIPGSLTLVSSLAYLNLSFNELTGEIPRSTQISGFDTSSFVGINLCGPPLTRNCSRGDGDQVHEHRDETEEDKPKIEWLYVLVCLGFAVRFSGVCTVLVLNKSWREAYFGMFGGIWDEAYVYALIKWRRLTKPSAPTS